MKLLLAKLLTLSVFVSPAVAETIEIEMLNRSVDGERMVFSTELIEAEIGDVIHFIPTDKSHNAQSVKGAIPKDQEGFRGKMNKEVYFEVTELGLTAVICLPHQSMGMVALIIVGGNTDNAEDVLRAKIPGKGGKKIVELVENARSLSGANFAD